MSPKVAEPSKPISKKRKEPSTSPKVVKIPKSISKKRKEPNMSPKAVESRKLIDNERKESDILEKLQQLRVDYTFQHQLMHFLMICMDDISKDPNGHANCVFMSDKFFKGNKRQRLRIHVLDVADEKEWAGAEMRRIQASCRELHVMRMEVLKERRELLHPGI
ncbi:MAG: hypothetical protein FRX48_03412 [Lasallia pustulata]|uniref:Uncharacterized protein n=1 Tax=Lasallia pustulata TaxID=136370 RepID=A0A5M8PTS7_9LECA|nr:MAG: hypothetical protein FRX48_03412 [Lasallia pustulata]